MANFLELQDKIGYEFKQEKLLRQAFRSPCCSKVIKLLSSMPFTFRFFISLRKGKK